MLDIIREDTFEMKEKYGDDRRTEITGDVSDVQHGRADRAGRRGRHRVSHEGYIKRLPVDTYRAQGRGGRGIKGTESQEGDFVEHLFVANTHDYLLFFTNQGRVYERRVYDVPEMSRTSQGRSDREPAGVPGRREDRQRAGGQGFRQGRAVPDVRDAEGHGEEDRAAAPTPTSARTASSRSAWKRAIR